MISLTYQLEMFRVFQLIWEQEKWEITICRNRFQAYGWLYLTFHSGHAYGGLCLNTNFVDRIRFLGATLESAVPMIAMARHLYNEAYFYKMITPRFQLYFYVLLFLLNRRFLGHYVYRYAYTIKTCVWNTAVTYIVIKTGFSNSTKMLLTPKQ